uniref:Uncharacterized protein n=1 Tax=Ascaris lumbricoides TaxID=6252 RepID=A0A0M3I5S4_ASCLU
MLQPHSGNGIFFYGTLIETICKKTFDKNINAMHTTIYSNLWRKLTRIRCLNDTNVDDECGYVTIAANNHQMLIPHMMIHPSWKQR